MKVDLVINFNDEILVDDYKDQMLQYFFRGIAKHLSWINNTFIIVASLNQLPKWLNKQNVEVILQADINQTAVETNEYSWELLSKNIKNLAENYLLIDLSTILIGDLFWFDFFDSSTFKPRIRAYPEKPQKLDPKSSLFYEQYNIIGKNTLEVPYILRPYPGIFPITKSLINNFYQQVMTEEESLKHNYGTPAIYAWGLLTNNIMQVTKSNIAMKYSFSTAEAGIIKYELMTNLSRKWLYVNFKKDYYKLLHPTALKWVLDGLEYRLGKEPSIYELK